MLKTVSALLGTLGLLVIFAGDAKAEDPAPKGAAQPAVSASFIFSCNDPQYYRDGSGAIVSASASSCKKRDGSYGGYTAWSGTCFGDVSNNDGNIGCFD